MLTEFWRFRFYSLATLMVWLFLAPSAYPPLVYPAVAGLVGFSCGPPSLVVPVCVCVCVCGVLSEAAELCLLSLLLLGVG